MASPTEQTAHLVPSPLNPRDIRVTGAALYLLPVATRVPLKFGSETLTSVTCARVRVEVTDRSGKCAGGWGETPLSVQWAWPSTLGYNVRHDAMIQFSRHLVESWCEFSRWGHPVEIGDAFTREILHPLQEKFAFEGGQSARIPYLAALICSSAFDLAVHDAYGVLHDVPVYETYCRPWMNHDLSYFLEPDEDSHVDFRGKYPAEFLRATPSLRLPAWHLVGGLDPLEWDELDGSDPGDGHPVLLDDWIDRDGLQCLKIKLRGNDATWDYDRIVRVGKIAIKHGVRYLTTDFNCTVIEPSYVIDVLERLSSEQPAIYDLLLYVEQPFPYELDQYPIDVSGVSALKPLFMDESAHDWQLIRTGRLLNWTGVALKTCKTQTGALLSLCWAKAHGMQLMVQDLTNPMLAQIPHLLLAAHADTIMGVETNAMQFYPEASAAESRFHPGLYVRRDGQVNLTTLAGPGFGYHGAQDARSLPSPVASAGFSPAVVGSATSREATP